MKYTIGIDVGGTNIAAGLVDENGIMVSIAGRKTCPPRPAEAYAEDMAELGRELVEKNGLFWEDVLWLGVGLPGTVNINKGALEYANNLGIVYAPLKEMLEKLLPCKIYLENDGDAAAWAEFLYGAGKGSRDFLMVTLGTGIGAGIIMNGKISRGVNYAAGEVGHMTIQFDGEVCSCGRRGCFEQYASASALVRQAKAMMKNDRNKDSLLWQLCSGNPEIVEGKQIFQAVREGDEKTKQVLEQYLGYLECGITNLINIFQPDILCIGGGISRAQDCLLEPLKELCSKHVYSRDSQVQTKIVPAKFYNEAGILGAALLGREGGICQ
ncbi:ROK family protein [Blautia pseudococcoides]|uniref:ROK family protein n=1 Tax=Blautia pseudococcoides TaxID=1796616 RepID=UPI003516C2A1